MTDFESLNPRTGEVIAKYENASKEAVNSAVANAAVSFATWGSLKFSERKRILLTWKREISNTSEDFAQLIALETGKPIGDARLEVSIAIAHLGWAAKKAEYYLKEDRRKPGLLMFNMQAEVHRIPYGVVGVIGPWNYPMFTPMGSIAYALAAGNTVVFKPSEFTPGVGKMLADSFSKISKYSNVLQTITGQIGRAHV